ncbi:hypothetical protein LCGC14_1205840 [marine sediment metagenome]|uniref:Uncharacterized protein n=1 Tax=marine sediment metagenome TaxID=412755 RepID=A0A0F9LJX9_9ZZZZ
MADTDLKLILGESFTPRVLAGFDKKVPIREIEDKATPGKTKPEFASIEENMLDFAKGQILRAAQFGEEMLVLEGNLPPRMTKEQVFK